MPMIPICERSLQRNPLLNLSFPLAIPFVDSALALEQLRAWQQVDKTALPLRLSGYKSNLANDLLYNLLAGGFEVGLFPESSQTDWLPAADSSAATSTLLLPSLIIRKVLAVKATLRRLWRP